MTPEELARQLSPAAFKARKVELLQTLVMIGERRIKPRTPVRKGTLRRSVTGRVISPGERGAVGTNLNYARSVHERKPFLSQGLADAQPEMERAAAAMGETFFAGVS